jgi:hypothetical protein
MRKLIHKSIRSQSKKEYKRALGVRVRKSTSVHSGVSQRGGLRCRSRRMKSCCVCADTAHTSIRIFLKLTTEL